MNVRVGDEIRSGRAIDVSDLPVTGTELRRALYCEDGGIEIDCERPGPVHEHVGVIHPGLSVSLGRALAAVARSRGHTTPEDERRERILTRIDEIQAESVDLTSSRRRVARAGDEERALRERVAALRGKVELLRDRDEDPSNHATALREAVMRLSEVETERIAAEQALDHARTRASAARDARERRLQLEDRATALARDARTALARNVYDEFASAVAVVPGAGTPGGSPGEYCGDPVTAALGVARMAAVTAPIVLGCERFDGAAEAADCLDAPVLRL